MEGCERQAERRDWCKKHHKRWLRYGNPLTVKLDRDLTREQRFWQKVNKTDGCWLWTGGLNRKGYGNFKHGTLSAAHRYSYRLLVGEIPDGLQLDHLCRTPSCVNPAHLEPVDSRTNIFRGDTEARRNAEKTECKWGHPFTEANTIRTPEGHRHCRECARERNRAYAARKRARRIEAA